MTINTVSGATCFAAWVEAATHLVGATGSEDSNLMIEILDPVAWDDAWFEKINPREVRDRGENPSDVANTIFPAATWRRSRDRADLYARYKAVHKRGRKKQWGTYFLRLIDFGASNVNQLERGITVLNTWANEPGTAIVFHLSSPELDVPKALGAPCLQLLQLQAKGGTIDLVAVYRNHDYFNKALANFVGLGRLLAFICDQTDRQPGKLVCHSGKAFCSSGKAAMTELLARA